MRLIVVRALPCHVRLERLFDIRSDLQKTLFEFGDRDLGQVSCIAVFEAAMGRSRKGGFQACEYGGWGHELPFGVIGDGYPFIDLVGHALDSLGLQLFFQFVFLTIGHTSCPRGCAALTEASRLVGNGLVNGERSHLHGAAGSFLQVRLIARIISAFFENKQPHPA